MPLQNRVTPFSEVVADPARGLVYGNRGCLHDATGTVRRHHNGRRWIACRLQFRGWHRHPLLQPGRFTELFFLDEVTAFAAGHRPCALCRREDYVRFGRLWAAAHPGETGADVIDVRLHAERHTGSGQRRHSAELADLPDGAFVVRAGDAWLVHGRSLLRWTPAGYVDRTPRPTREEASVLTPPSLLTVLARGWAPDVPLVHPTGQLHGDQGRSRRWPST